MPRSLQTLWDEILAFNDKHYPGWRRTPLIYLTNALAGESGEVCNKMKHRFGGGTHKIIPTDSEILEEIVDVFIYMVLLIECLDERGQRGFIDAGYRKLKVNVDRLEEDL